MIFTRSASAPSPERTHHCRKCLYQLDGSVTPVCPECAAPFDLNKPATFVIGPLQAQSIRRALRAPGWIYHLLLATSIGAFAYASAAIEWWSRIAALSFGACIVLLGWWMLRALIACPVRWRHGRNRAAHRLAGIAWLLAPAAAAVLYLCVFHDLALRMRVALSAPWLQSKSGDIQSLFLANESARHGLFYITQTARTASGIWFGLGKPKAAAEPLYLVHIDRADLVKDWEGFGFWPAISDWHLYPADSLTLPSKIAQQPLKHLSTAWWDVVQNGEKNTTPPIPIPPPPPPPWWMPTTPTSAPASARATSTVLPRLLYFEMGLDYLWRTPFGGSPYWHVLPGSAQALEKLHFALEH